MTGLQPFDRSAFEAALNDLEVSLGDLMGIQNIFDYWYRVASAGGGVGIGQMFQYSVPCQNHPFTWFFQSPIVGDDNIGVFQGNFDGQFQAGRLWARGVVDDVRTAAEHYIEVDTPVMAQAALDLYRDVAAPLDALLREGYDKSARRGLSLRGTLGHFEGRTAQGLSDFLSIVSDSATLWAKYATLTAGIYAAAALIINACQVDMVECPARAAEQADKLVAAWAQYNNNTVCPYSNGDGGSLLETLLQVTEFVAFGSSVAELIPGVGEVVGTVGGVADIAATVLDHSVGDRAKTDVPLTDQDAGSLADRVRDTVVVKAVNGAAAALADLDRSRIDQHGKTLSTGGSDMVKDIAQQGSNFFTPLFFHESDPGPGDMWFNRGMFE